MKGSFKNLFIVIMILVSLIGSSIQTKPADALAYPTNTITINLPTSPVTWSTVKLYDVWGYDASTYTVGEGTYTQSGTTYKRPLIYKNGSPWGSTVPGFLSSDWTAGDLRAIWGYNADTVYTVGHGKALGIDRPLIYKKNPGTETWSSSGPLLPSEGQPGGWVAGFLEDVWGPSATVTYAVGYGNTELAPTKPLIYRTTNTGDTWSSILPSLPLEWNGFLTGIWGSSASDVYVVGYANTKPNNVPLIYKGAGASWTRNISLVLPSGWSNGALTSIWGSATDGIYAVGSGSSSGTSAMPLVYHSTNGTSWELLNPAMPSGWTSASLTSVWGSNGTVYATGYGSDAAGKVTPVVYRKISSGWAATIPDMGGWNSRYMEGMWGSDANHVYLAGYGNTTTATGQPLLYYVDGPDTAAPGDITDLAANPGPVVGSIRLTWTAPADDAGNPYSGPVESYTIKYSTGSLGDCSSGTAVSAPVPTMPGIAQDVTVSGLTQGARYNFIICTQDEEGLVNSPALISANAKAPIIVSTGGINRGSYVIPIGSSTRVSYTGVDNGPVKIVSMDDSLLIASERINLLNHPTVESYAEMMGIPATQLTDTYLFPWYNNVGLDSQLRFGNVGTANTTVTVKIGGTVRGTYPLTPNQSVRVSFAGVDSGPVEVKSSDGVLIIASERINLLNHPSVASYSELMGLSASSVVGTKYMFPWYNNVGLDSQLRFGNVGTANTTVTVKIGGTVRGSYPLGPNQSTRVSFAGVDSGPVEVTSSGGVPIIASERINLLNHPSVASYSEMMGLSGTTLTHTKYVFPWYNNVGLDSQLRFGNVGTANTTVTVKIGGEVQGSYPLSPNQSVRVSFAGVDSGPVEIESSGGVPIIASERINLLNHPTVSSYAEMMGLSVGAPLGLPGNQLSDTYWFPWYNNVGLDSQLRFGIP